MGGALIRRLRLAVNCGGEKDSRTLTLRDFRSGPCLVFDVFRWSFKRENLLFVQVRPVRQLVVLKNPWWTPEPEQQTNGLVLAGGIAFRTWWSVNFDGDTHGAPRAIKSIALRALQ